MARGSERRAGRAGRPRDRPGSPGWRRSRSTTSVGVGGDVALDQAEGDRAQLVVPGRAADEADRAAVQLQRRSRRGQCVGTCRPGAAGPAAAAAGRGCAPGRPSPGRGSSPCPGARRPRAGRSRSGSSGGRCPGRSAARPPAIRRASYAQVPARGAPASTAASSRAGHEDSRPPSESCPARARWSSGPAPAGPDHRELVAAIGHLDPHQEPHPVQPGHQRPRPRPARCGPRTSRRRRRRRARARCGPAGTGPARSRPPCGARPSSCWVVSECSQAKPIRPRHRQHAAVATGRRRPRPARAAAARASGRRSARPPGVRTVGHEYRHISSATSARCFFPPMPGRDTEWRAGRPDHRAQPGGGLDPAVPDPDPARPERHRASRPARPGRGRPRSTAIGPRNGRPTPRSSSGCRSARRPVAAPPSTWCLTRARENRSQFVLTQAARPGDDLLADRTHGQAGPAQGHPAHRPGARRAAGDHRGHRGEVRLRLPPPAGHARPGCGWPPATTRWPSTTEIVAAVERKTVDDLASSLLAGRLTYALAELAALPRAAVVVEAGYSKIFTQTLQLRRHGRRGARRGPGPIPERADHVLREPGHGPGMDLPLAGRLPGRVADGAGHDRPGADLRAGAIISESGRPEPTAAQIRRWARDQGMAVPDKGRIPARVRQAFARAGGDVTPRLSRAHICDCSGRPAAALSKVHSRSPSTVPYSRCPAE